jgi:exopolysaccharide production protein ExoQ
MLLASTAAFSSHRRKFEGYVPVKVREASMREARRA